MDTHSHEHTITVLDVISNLGSDSAEQNVTTTYTGKIRSRVEFADLCAF